MIEDLQARFLPRFLSTARQRIERVRGIVASRDHGALLGAVRELHALVGEASLLGLEVVIPRAHHAEQVTQALADTRGDEAAVGFALDALEKGLELVTPSLTGERSP
jgi:HPt (histidine-containing phosphotransfer) domain-containing protein